MEFDDPPVLILETPNFPFEEFGWHCYSISCLSDEMIIVYYTRKGPIVQVFVANLKEDINQIYFMNDDGLKQEDKEKSHGTVKILPGKDRFYIIEIYYEKNRNKIQVSCQYEYVYQSGALTQSNISTVYVKSNIKQF